MMAEMKDFGAVLLNFLFNRNLDSYVLLRIRVQMVFLIFLYLVTGIVSAVGLLNALRILDAVTEILMLYLMADMQAAPFKNHMFPLWAIFLLSVRSTVNIISNYDTSLDLTNMLKLWAAALLNVKHGSKSLFCSFWLFWGVLVVKSLYRIRAPKLASKSLWHGRSSELVHEYMRAVDHKPSNLDAVTLEGCKFLVYGESKNNITKKGISPSVSNIKSVIALDTVWLHHGAPLEHTINTEKNTIKDLTLAFALSRLLRCRMEGGKLHEDTISMTSKIICSRIIHDTVDDDNNDKNMILDGILQMDLLFLVQHVHTGYHMVFSQRLAWLCFPILQFIVLQLTCLWFFLLVLYINLSRTNVTDVYITVVSITIISVMQILEVLRYMSSNWTGLLLVCNYINCRSNNRCMEKVLGRMISSFPLFFPERLAVDFTSRYDFLRSSSYSQGKLRESLMSPDLKRRDSVIVAVIRALACYMEEERLPSHRLPAPRVSARAQPYWSACLRLPSCSHVILVLHIATNLCQLKLERDRGDTNNNAGLSRFFVRNTRAYLGRDNPSKANWVANCLSRNCLDLLISEPSLLPENVLASKKLLLDTIQLAHDILRGCDSPQSRYDELIALSQEAEDVPPDGAPQDIKLCAKLLLMQGAMMGKKLIESEDEESRWDILAEVWAHILVQIAPSSKMEAHMEALLQFRAPLVTLVWALLCHCGIEKSELWPEER